MALPSDLRTLLWRQLPLTIVENSAPLLRYWLELVAPAAFAHRQLFENGHLNEQEWLLKVAAWSGLVGYTNQLFLPHELTSLQAALSGNVAIFIDAVLRGDRNEKCLLAILRQNARNPDAAETMLAYWLASFEDHNPPLDLSDLINEMLLGRIVLSRRICLLILAAISIESRMYEQLFFHGVLVGLGETSSPSGKTLGFSFIEGYGLAGGRNFEGVMALAADASYRAGIIDSVQALLNLPEAAAPEDDSSALSYLAYHLIDKLPKTSSRPFPDKIVELGHTYEVMFERAPKMLAIVPNVYASSSRRDGYLDMLRLIINPDLPRSALPNLITDDDLFAFLGRFDLMEVEPTADRNFYDYTGLHHIVRPEKLLDLIVEHPQSMIMLDNIVFEQAMLQGHFAEVAAEYFRRVPYQNRFVEQIESPAHTTLDAFRAVYYGGVTRQVTAQGLHTYRPNWNNSFLLQWVANELEFVQAGQQIVTERDYEKMTGVILQFRCQRKTVNEHANAYDYQTWRTILPELPERMIPSTTLIKVQDLLAIV